MNRSVPISQRLRSWAPISARSRGFTLIELLVVIAIMMILMALLVSVISKSGAAKKIALATRQVSEVVVAAKNYYEVYSMVQSFRLSLGILATVPAVLAGAAIALRLTGTTLNIQSFLGAIMAVGIAVANSILLVSFAERARKGGLTARAAAVDGATSRLRAILMTATAMIAGMVPLALGNGDGGAQTAPLARAVIGGLFFATLATLSVLPAFYAILQARAAAQSASLDPDDPESRFYENPA